MHEAFKHILVPTDFGEPSSHALDAALGLASKYGSKLTILHACTIPPAAYAGYADGIAWPIDEMQRAAKSELDALIARSKIAHPNVQGLFATSDASHAIMQALEDTSIDLVVIGTHGRRGLSRLFLGSVAEKIVRMSPVPVLTVQGPGDREAKRKAMASVA